MRNRLTLLVAVLGLVVGACAGIPSQITLPDGGGETATTVSPGTTAPPDTSEGSDTTSAPDSTAAPDTTSAPDTSEAEAAGEDDDGGVDSSVIWVVLGLVLLLILLGWLMGRSRRPSPPSATPAAAPPPTWKDHLRDGYSEARWLSDSMTEDLAIWRGNSLASQEEAAGTGMADRWNQLDSKMNLAVDHLYKAEASAPDQPTSRLIRDVVDKLNALRANVDARAEARWEATRAVSDAGIAERERVAATNLAEARAGLDVALDSIAGLR